MAKPFEVLLLHLAMLCVDKCLMSWVLSSQLRKLLGLGPKRCQSRMLAKVMGSLAATLDCALLQGSRPWIVCGKGVGYPGRHRENRELHVSATAHGLMLQNYFKCARRAEVGVWYESAWHCHPCPLHRGSKYVNKVTSGPRV